MSETWITLSDDEVFAKDSPERTSIAAVKRRDDLAEKVLQTTELVRDAYRNGGRPLGPDGTIPLALKARAVAIALWRFVTDGVPQNEKIQTKQRQQACADAEAYLTKIALREIKGAGYAQIVTKQPRQATRDTLSGL